MKTLVHMAVIVVVAAGIGLAANAVHTTRNDGLSLEWWPQHYRAATSVKGCVESPAVPPPGGSPATGTGADVPADPPPPPVEKGPSEGTPTTPSGTPTPPTLTKSAVATPNGTGDADNSGTGAGDETGNKGETGNEGGTGEDDAHSRYPMITFDEAIEELAAGSLFIDARRSREYVAGHIPGARSCSAWEQPGEKINALLSEGVVTEAPTIIYCSNSRECEDSLIVCDRLASVGFVDLRIYKGGFPEFKEKRPDLVATGEEPGVVDPDAVESGGEK